MTRGDEGGIRVPTVGGKYIEGLVGQPRYINPLLASANDVDMDLSRIIFSGLLKFDKDLNLIPDLASDMPEISTDGREYTIRLKENISWHDGVNLNADDVVFTLQTIQNPDYQSPLRLSWNKVAVEKIDDLTVKIIAPESSATFIANFTVGIIPKHIWEAIPAETFALSKFNMEAVGSGPFKLAEIKRGREGDVRSIKLENFSRYYGDGPYLKNITFNFYATADRLIDAYHSRDIMGLGYVPFDQSIFIDPNRGKIQQTLLPLPQYQAVFINRTKNPAPLEDVRVRTALAKSIDKERIISEVYGSKASPAYGPILPGHLGFDEQMLTTDLNIYDTARAATLLEEAGWIMDPDSGFRKDNLGRIITLSLATNNFPPNVRVAQLLKEMWEGIGIQMILNIEAVADLEERFIRPRNYELLLFSENVGPDPDPFAFWHSTQLRDPGLNLSTFANQTADKLLIEARANILASERATKYVEFQKLFVADVPAIFIDRSVFVYNLPSDVKGFDLDTITTPSERFASIDKWYIDTRSVNE